MSKQVRVRFAPSPTGPLHIGGVRTALFNYLFAKKNNGVFYLRIEDTDQNRFVPGAEEYIFEALEWLGIAPSETVGKNEKFGPYRQSERKPLYKQYADQLINSGWAYYAFDTAEALELQRKEKGETFIYNWSIREKMDTSIGLSKEERDRRIALEEYVIRFKMPKDETLELQDIIRGKVKFETKVLDDKILFKSDGMPTYHLANIVDDHLMETSHVIRGEEWLSSMPLHYLLYKAFGWEAPEFAHLPLILKPDPISFLNKNSIEKFVNLYSDDFLSKSKFDESETKKIIKQIFENYKNLSESLKIDDNKDSNIKREIKTFLKKNLYGKLSKRDGDKIGFPAFPLEWKTEESVSSGYREEGFLPEAVINFLVLLGWNDETDKELFTLKELGNIFDLKRVHKAGAKFDPDKVKWFNHKYLTKKSGNYLFSNFSNELEKRNIKFSEKKTIKILNLIKKRANFEKELWEASSYFFLAPECFDEKLSNFVNYNTKFELNEFMRNLDSIKVFKNELINIAFENSNITNEKMKQILRIGLVGKLKGEDLFIIMELIGKRETFKRLDKLVKNL